ncbi:hypothetical protein WJ16_21985 [Burkholderia metallica]|nr:hypothetical protein WJ16_21985 [Burkholderia metallica]
MVLGATVVSEIYIACGNEISVCIVTPFSCLVVRTSTSFLPAQLRVRYVYVRHRIAVIVAR